MLPARRNNKSNKLAVVIVESHQHALEHVHFALRRNQHCRLERWTMLHFDAHPDLACPAHVPAHLCFAPRYKCNDDEYDENKNLYEHLDMSRSGIAEWILPLALAANLSRVDWIKPAWSRQLPNGTHVFHVGVVDDNPTIPIESFLDLSDTARVRVDWNCPYYADDESVVATDDLVLKQELTINVSSEHDAANANNMYQTPWLLDICLDYFYCLNPFVSDDSMDEAFSALLLNAVSTSCFGTNKHHEQMKDVFVFRELLATYLKLVSSSGVEAAMTELAMNNLLVFYPNAKDATNLLTQLADALLRDSDKINNNSLLNAALEAIPNLTMPHMPTSADQIHESMRFVQSAIHQQSTPPFLITIARSALDGFVPASLVESLQTQVLRVLHQQYCGCDRESFVPVNFSDACELKIVFDYGEWEGATLDDN
jgi:hypothetical protein